MVKLMQCSVYKCDLTVYKYQGISSCLQLVNMCVMSRGDNYVHLVQQTVLSNQIPKPWIIIVFCTFVELYIRICVFYLLSSFVHA